jgi:hypothetical protein
MQTKAPPGGILITDDTQREVREYIRCTELGPIQIKGIVKPITAYSVEEILVDMEKVRAAAGGTERSPVQAGSLERLRESMFIPEFRVPGDKADRPGVELLRDLFGEIARSVGDLLPDPQEYDFTKFLQARWVELMRRL